MSNETVSLAVQTKRPSKGWIDSLGRVLPSNQVVFISRETVDLTLAMYSGRSALALSSNGHKIAAKDPSDLDGDILWQSSNVTSSAAELAAGTLKFGDVNLNTVECNAFIGTDDAKRIRIEIIELTAGGVEEKVLLRADALLLHDTIQGDEDDPVYAADLVHNASASAAPTTGDDTGDGYAAGSVWVYGSRVWMCLDATAGAAVWYELTAAALKALAGVTPAADKVAYFTSASAAAVATLTSWARTLLAAADAAAGRTVLGVDAAGTAAAAVAALEALTTNGAATGTLSVNLANPEQLWTLTGNVVVDATTGAASGKVKRATIHLVASGATRTVTLPGTWRWPNGNKPASDVISLDAGETGELIVEDRDNSALVRAWYAEDET